MWGMKKRSEPQKWRDVPGGAQAERQGDRRVSVCSPRRALRLLVEPTSQVAIPRILLCDCKARARSFTSIGIGTMKVCTILVIPPNRTWLAEGRVSIVSRIEKMGVRVIVDDGVENASLEGVHRILVILPNNNWNRVTSLTRIGRLRGLQVSHSTSASLEERLREDLGLPWCDEYGRRP